MPVPKTASDGYSDSYFDEGEIYAIMEQGEAARAKLKEKKRKKPDRKES